MASLMPSLTKGVALSTPKSRRLLVSFSVKSSSEARFV
jgi:hypothetical protein